MRALATAFSLAAATFVTGTVSAVPAGGAPVGAGFTVKASDLAFILAQIQIAEHHAEVQNGGAVDPCDGLLGTGPHQVPSPLVSYGLRTVDGSCNNLQPGRGEFGASQNLFPRLTTPDFRPAESGTSYTQSTGLVRDSEPRLVSNLIVDQTSANLAAVRAAGYQVRSQDPNTGIVPCTTDPTPGDPDGTPDGCVPSHQTLFIPNVTTDVGLSPPYNSLFTIFGQFFDHGLDKVTNGNNGAVRVPLRADDPLIAGPDHIFGNADDLPSFLRFMPLTRATWSAGPNGIPGDGDDVHEGENTDSPWVDLSQNYASHPSHQVFLREYTMISGRPIETGRFAGSDGPDADPDHDLMQTWGDVKLNAHDLLGIQLVDTDVNNIPLLITDPYGNFVPGPLRGMPMVVFPTGAPGGTIQEGDPTANGGLGLDISAATRIGISFLNDIAHNAGPGTAASPLTPDADGVINLGATLAPGEYDDEMLAAHFIAGDGRVNENIGLTSIHTVFEKEHNRLANEFDSTTLPANPTLQTAYQTTNCPSGCTTNIPGQPVTFTYGQRLFLAARFVTEMEYQHLVFEEFARKIQPLIAPFQVYHDNIDPAITAEFAHAVYRLGHSMLNDTIPRVTPDGTTRYDIELFDAFLNPPEFARGPGGAPLSGGEAAGGIFLGLSDQVGNELDEFVAETLRNRLLGLPLDLAALNLTRGRSEGVPRLNSVRRQLHNTTNDSALTPYVNWVDFGLNLKHPESLLNFVAAYGMHPSIVAETTIAGRREAARKIVDPLPADVPPPDAAAFMFGDLYPGGIDAGPDGQVGTDCGTPAESPECADNTPIPPVDWSNVGGATITGVDDVELWVGGLAEKTELFGGLLGSTFNYVFETQMADLQNGDRFYYLARTPGMNLRTQLEGNSFAELLMRNTTAHTLKADAFATADCKFDIGRINALGYPAAPGSTITGAGSVNDDPASECNENRLLIKQTATQLRYRTTNTVDPPGINGQGVYNGTAGVDDIYGGVDNDTVLGNEGNDVIEGSGGDDVVLGGEGNDRITDTGGADVPKGGPGNDAIDAGPGDDIIMSGDGDDFSSGGANSNETFAGNGNDLVLDGTGAGTVFGGSGDDWVESQEGQELLCGENCAPFFDDPDDPGHDVLIGGNGEEDYDAEGGDDLLSAGPGVERNAGAAGFDWIYFQYDPLPANADLDLKFTTVLPVNVLRDRVQEVEAISGAGQNDVINGSELAPKTLGGVGVGEVGDTGCDVLDADGVARISGLDQIVTSLPSPLAPVLAATKAYRCPLSGANVWGEGDILLGGAGNDTIMGRGADDIIDGDRWLRTRLSVRTDPNNAATEIGSTFGLTTQAVTGNYGPGTAGKTLQAAIMAGQVNPGNVQIVREIVAGGGIDTAVFRAPLADYDITNFDGVVTVAHVRGAGAGGGGGGVANPVDGTDTLRNVEFLQFSDGTIPVPPPVPVPAIAVGPSTTPIAFAARAVGAAPVTRTLTITSTGAGPLQITSVAITGAGAAGFSQTNTCTAPLTPGQTCTITVANSPSALGVETADLVINNNVPGGSPITIALSGQGVLNTPATGTPAISDVTPTETFAVTATLGTIADVDGTTTSTFALQWQRTTTAAGGAFVDIPGATSATFTPGPTETNRRLRVVVSFVDDIGAIESATSAATIVVGDFFPGIGESNAGADVRTGTAGQDWLLGGASADTLSGGAESDFLEGGDADDALSGNAGDDIFGYTGSANGFDTVAGGGGLDTIIAQGPNTVIGLRALTGVETIDSLGFPGVTISGSAGVEVFNFSAVNLIGIAAIRGGGGADNIIGSAAADKIIGGGSIDTINGGGGSDTIEGGLGNDVIDTLTGDDILVARPGGIGADDIRNFDSAPAGGQDLIDLRPLGITAATFATNVTLTTVAGNGGGTLVTIAGQGTMRLRGVAIATVTIQDFLVN